MRTGRRLLPLVVLFGVLAATAAVALAGTVSWGSAIEVPGIASLNVGGSAGLSSVSCASAGNCSAVGWYTDSAGQQVYVVSEQGGVWGTAIEVPGSAALNTSGAAELGQVSCAGAGGCVAGGGFSDFSDFIGTAFLVEQTNGVWGTAFQVPGLAALDTFKASDVTSVSCASPGDCLVGGDFADASNGLDLDLDYAAFMVSEHGGVWGTPFVVWGNSSVSSVSCAGAGYCVTGGSSGGQAYLVTLSNGHWLFKPKLPGVAALSAGGLSQVTSVSCASPGNCAVGGLYTYGRKGVREHAFLVKETNGKWGKAIAVFGGAAESVSASCAAAGNCIAGGYFAKGGHTQAYVVAERKGKWGSGIRVPGLSALGGARPSSVYALSCASTAGNCAATGYYMDPAGKFQAFVAGEQSGVWGKAVEVPGTAALDAGGTGGVGAAVSCAGTGSCAVGGTYNDGSAYQPFVTTP